MKKLITIALLTLTMAVQAQVFTPIPNDKVYHIGAGAVLSTWGTFAGKSLELSDENALLMGIGTGVAAGVGKELWDVSWRLFGYKDQFDVNDIAATTLGSIVGAGLTYAGIKIFKKKPPVIYGVLDKRNIKLGIVKTF